jgi:hypothetical protein
MGVKHHFAGVANKTDQRVALIRDGFTGFCQEETSRFVRESVLAGVENGGIAFVYNIDQSGENALRYMGCRRPGRWSLRC